jgi:hypothetical protein
MSVSAILRQRPGRRLWPILVAGVGIACAAVAGSAGGAASSPRASALSFKLDHFLCYSITSEGSSTPTATIRDQFKQTRKDTVVAPQWLCNWAEKDGSHVQSRRDHLLCYSVTSKESFDNVHVKVTNQFKAVKLTAFKPNGLCLPSGKNPKQASSPLPKGLGYFQCYPVKPFAKVASHKVEVHDEFGTATYSTGQPSRLCNPASKNLSAIVDPREHLLCYRIRPLTTPVTGKVVWITNQFAKEPLAVKTLAPQLLCLPSRKSVVGS